VTTPGCICAGCGALRVGRRWFGPRSTTGRKARATSERLQVDICPRCEQRGSGLPHGYIHLDGAFVKSHRPAIEALIQRVADDCHDELPAAALLACEDDGSGGLLVTTSLGHVAARIGHALEATYDGQLHYGVVPGTSVSHVWWRHEPGAGDRQ
jgi:hypothetical protein